MIYLINNSDNQITSESWLSYKPESFLVYLDDIELGTFVNESVYNEYITITIPSTNLVNLQNKEYTLKLYHNLSLLKVELVTVISDTQLEIKTVTNNTNNIIFYE
jgi:hypothetical protein